MTLLSYLAFLGFFITLGTESIASENTSDLFPAANVAKAAAAWLPGDGAASAEYEEATDKCLVFKSPVGSNQAGTASWDLPVNIKLTSGCSIEIEVEFSNRKALDSIAFYLKSGRGWYAWKPPIKEHNRQTFIFRTNNAWTEGKPAGLNSVSGVRLRVNRAGPEASFVRVYHLRVRQPEEIVIVQGTVSVPQSDRGFAESTALNISLLLDDLGVRHSIVDDKELVELKSRPGIAILPYNQIPPSDEIKTLSSIVAKGGKLIVFYASSPELARLMHTTIGEYKATTSQGRWSSFAFAGNALPNAPAEVFQESQNIITVWPKDKTGEVIAYWRDANNKPDNDPAWVRTESGCWMTHVLMPGDDQNKKALLLAILAGYRPELWKQAAFHASEKAGTFAGFSNLADAIAEIKASSSSSLNQAEIYSLLDDAADIGKKMRQALAAGEYPAAIRATEALNLSLMRAFNLSRTSGLPGFRGVWDHSGLGLYPGDWNKTCRILADYGINAVFPNLQCPGFALYPGKTTQTAPAVVCYGDQAAASVKAAHKAGLTIHAWKICWNLGQAEKLFIDKMNRGGRLQKNDLGATVQWLCPTHPANIALETDSIAELIRSYDFDGIHLDYIRYPDASACFCDGCRTRFERDLHTQVSNWPAGARSGEWKTQYQVWRSAQITAFVKSTHDMVKAIKPALKLSAAVYPNPPQCAESIGQDWTTWLNQGFLDFVCPMNYTASTLTFDEMLRNQIKAVVDKSAIYPGIGVRADSGSLNPSQVIMQINASQSNQLSGFVLFTLDRTLERDVLPLLYLKPAVKK